MARECCVPICDLNGTRIGWIHMSSLSQDILNKLLYPRPPGEEERLCLDVDMRLKTESQIQEEEDHGQRP